MLCKHCALPNDGGTLAIQEPTSSRLRHRNPGRQHGAVSFDGVAEVHPMYSCRCYTLRTDYDWQNHHSAASGPALKGRVVSGGDSTIVCWRSCQKLKAVTQPVYSPHHSDSISVADGFSRDTNSVA